ncbi:MAG: T9SS type A sorting domain-containing protein [Ignavibacteriales bacterium]|nr:T9SS type A sorting domain-containing protein [Ignavibacteriales bacterium]
MKNHRRTENKKETELKMLYIENSKCRVLLTFFLVVQSIGSSLCFGQDFYPLQAGDVWQYKVTFQGDFNGYSTKQIIRDTLMPNGNRYFVFSNGAAERVTDSLVSYRYDSRNFDLDTSTAELVLNRFNSPIGTAWRSFEMQADPRGMIAKMEQSSSSVWFGEIVEMKLISYYTQSGLFGANNYYSKKHGLVYSALEGGASYELTGARIGGVVYGVITGIVNSHSKMPGGFSVANPYPNPFNSSTTIEYTLSEENVVSISVYGILGNLVKSLQPEKRSQGVYLVRWNLDDEAGRKLPSGVYFFRISSGRNGVIRKVLAIQ